MKDSLYICGLKWAVLLVFIMFLISPCDAQSQWGRDSLKTAYDLVGKLPEVKAYCHRADSLYHGTAITAQMLVRADPTP